MLIGIAGKAGSGKSTAADYLVQHHGFYTASWAEPLKAALAVMGFPEPTNRDLKEAQIPGFDFSWREAAQLLGTEWGRGLDPDIWTKLMARRLEGKGDLSFVISDVRFENESAMIRAQGGIVWHIKGREVDLGEHAAHASEAGILLYPSKDELIDNRGSLEGLYAQIDKLMEAK